jgi:hypothetical protein
MPLTWRSGWNPSLMQNNLRICREMSSSLLVPCVLILRAWMQNTFAATRRRTLRAATVLAWLGVTSSQPDRTAGELALDERADIGLDALVSADDWSAGSGVDVRLQLGHFGLDRIPEAVAAVIRD